MLWLTLTLSLLTVIIITFVVKMILRKLLQIEKQKKGFFSYNHINDLHRKIDWTIRIVSTIALIIIQYIIVFNGYSFNINLIGILLFALVQYITQAFFEYKYSQNKKQSILTLSEMVICAVSIITIIQMDLFSSIS